MNANLLIPTSLIHSAAGAFCSAMARARVDGPGEDLRGLNCSLLDPCGHHHFLASQSVWMISVPSLSTLRTLRVQGPKYFRASGPKYHSDYSIWASNPHYLSPWTLRGQHLSWAGYSSARVSTSCCPRRS